MGLTRLNKFEQELGRVLFRENLGRVGEVLSELVGWIGKEIDYLEKNIGASSPSAAGPIISIAGVSGGSTPAGLTIEIRTGSTVLTANTPATIVYMKDGVASPLPSATHYLKADVYNSAGEWITSSLPTAKTVNGFTITSPEAGRVDHIAAEFT